MAPVWKNDSLRIKIFAPQLQKSSYAYDNKAQSNPMSEVNYFLCVVLVQFKSYKWWVEPTDHVIFLLI